MASIALAAGGRRTIQFFGPDRKRRSIRLGKATARQADAVRTRVELLVVAAITGTAADLDTARWLAALPSDLYGTLAAVGLTTPRDRETVGPFVAAYIAGRDDAKPNTVAHLRRAENDLLGFFGADKLLRAVTAGGADDFRRYLLRRGLVENTARRIVGRAKQFFTAAVRRRLIDCNPFADQKCAVGSNPERLRFITLAEADAVLAACPDPEWRLLFALSRFGGLRCPSEHLALRWQDVDWAAGRLTVTSPKTEHHEGKGYRAVPIFPELRPYLADAFDAAEPGAEHVIARYRDANANLRTQLLRIIRRAGPPPWPKVFQNLRSTRETELAESFPMHVVCAWIGNSQPVAAKHYLQVTDAHFEKAAGGAMQNPVQYTSAYTGTEPQAVRSGHEKTPGSPGVATSCGPMMCAKAPRVGLEPTTYGLTVRRSTD